MKKARKRIRVAAVVMVPVMAVLTLAFLITLVDGGRISFGTESLGAGYEKWLARVLGFDLAPGETLVIGWYEYEVFTEDNMRVEVEGTLFLNDAWAAIVLSVHMLVFLGWLGEIGLIIALIVLRRKEKKERTHAETH